MTISSVLQPVALRAATLPVFLLLWLIPFPAMPQDAAVLSGRALTCALRAGGYNLYFRHAATDWSLTDRVEQEGDWLSCDAARMRQLSDAGRRTARSVGDAMRALEVPVGLVIASPYCRTRETAEEMRLGPVVSTTDIMNLRAAGYVGGTDAVVATARARLAAPPERGTNTVLVAHGNLVRAATGVYPEEGEAAIFRPQGGGFTFVGSLTPAQWARLATEQASSAEPWCKP